MSTTVRLLLVADDSMLVDMGEDSDADSVSLEVASSDDDDASAAVPPANLLLDDCRLAPPGELSADQSFAYPAGDAKEKSKNQGV